MRVVPDPGPLRRIIEESFRGVLPEQARMPRNLKLVDIGEYVYDEGSGWMTRVESIKDMRSGRTRRADHTTLLLRKG